MKKHIGKISVVFLGLSLLFVILGVKNYYENQKKEQNFKLGVLLYREDDEFISTVANAMEEEKNEFKKKYGQNLFLTFKDAKGNQTLQNQQMDVLLQNDYDALAINIVDRTVAAGMVEKAKQAGIPVIFFNREPVRNDLNRWKKAFYVGSSARESGEKEAQIIVDNWKNNPKFLDLNGDGKLQYVLLEGEELHQDSLIRTEASLQALEKGGIELQRLNRGTANWMRQPARQLMEKWLQNSPEEIELVISNNDEMALGALEAVKGANLPYFPAIVGIDGTKGAIEAVNAGEMLGTVINPSKAQAQTIINFAASIKMDKNKAPAVTPIDGHYAWIPYQIYTR